MIDEYLENCLYFTATVLQRKMTKLAEKHFGLLGLSPREAYLITLVSENPGVSQKDAGDRLHQLESSISRLVQDLVSSGLMVKSSEGKTHALEVTEKGKNLVPGIKKAWEDLYAEYAGLLGEDRADRITQEIFAVNKVL